MYFINSVGKVYVVNNRVFCTTSKGRETFEASNSLTLIYAFHDFVTHLMLIEEREMQQKHLNDKKHI